MATELAAGTSQLCLASFNTQRLEQLRTGIAGELVQVAAKGRGALVICDISDRRPRVITQSPLLKAASSRRSACREGSRKPSFLWSRRILERLQAIQNKQ